MHREQMASELQMATHIDTVDENRWAAVDKILPELISSGMLKQCEELNPVQQQTHPSCWTGPERQRNIDA